MGWEGLRGGWEDLKMGWEGLRGGWKDLKMGWEALRGGWEDFRGGWGTSEEAGRASEGAEWDLREMGGPINNLLTITIIT